MKSNELDMKGKKILLVNTGSQKKRFIIKKLKSLWLNIIILNKDINWAKGYSSNWILADTANHVDSINAVNNYLVTNNTKFDWILTFWEDDVLLTSKLIDKYWTPWISFDVANKARNKFLFRKFCFENWLPTPYYKLVKNIDDIAHIVNNFTFPVVLKPSYWSSSAFVIKADNEEELLSSYKYTQEALSINIESALSDWTEILVEEYIDWDEVDIDIILQNWRIKFYSISDNNKTKEPFFVETWQNIPSNLPKSYQEMLIDMADEVLDKLWIQNWCLHFEAKFTKNWPVPIEINLRMGWDEVYSFVKWAWKVDLIENAVKIALWTHIRKIKKNEIPYKYLAWKYFLPDCSGVLIKLDIDQKIKNKKYLEELNFFKKIWHSVFVPPEWYESIWWLTVLWNNSSDAESNLFEAVWYVNFEIAKFHHSSSIWKSNGKTKFSFSELDKDIFIWKKSLENINKLDETDNLHIWIARNITCDEIDLVWKEYISISKKIWKIIEKLWYKVSFFDFNNVSKVLNEIKKSDVSLMFNLCEQLNNSIEYKPHVASILDVLQIPYTWSNPFTLNLCADKISAKKVLSYHWIPTPKWDCAFMINDEIRSDLKYPLITKPWNTDNSFWVSNNSVVHNKKELMSQIDIIINELWKPALIEEYIEWDEYDVSILWNYNWKIKVLPFCRSIFTDLPEWYAHIYPYESKWWDKNPIYDRIITQCPPKKVWANLMTLIKEIAIDAYNILGCNDYWRIEIKVDKNNNPYFIELNANPSLSEDWLLYSSAKAGWLSYMSLLEEIIFLSIERNKIKLKFNL